MRFLIVTFDPPENVGGVEGRASAYTRELIRAGHQVELVALAPAYDFSSIRFHGARLHRYPSSSRRVTSVFREAARMLAGASIDSIFVLSGALTLFGTLLVLLGRVTGRRTVIFLYGKDILGTKGPVGRFTLIASSILAGGIAVNSRYTSGLIPRFVARKVRILYPGVDPAITLPAPPGVVGGSRILFVGRLVERKGVDDILRALPAVLAALPGVVLDVVGDGPDRSRLQEIAREMHVGDKVSFLGTLRGQALYERYSLASLLVMPSRAGQNDVEGFGTVFLEAGLFGKPSIGSRSGGIPEAIVDGETGILISENRVELLAAALVDLLRDGSKRERLGQNARRRVLSSFTWEASTKSLLDAMNPKATPPSMKNDSVP